MPTGNLPKEAAALHKKVYDQSLSDSCDKECAAKKAWAAVKRGWKKEGDTWVKKQSLSEFSFTIKKASLDPETGEMRWRADTSDTELDSYGDKMSLSLFEDFLSRIDKMEAPPEDFTSDYWKGGNPYLSISHYPDLEGKGVPGEVESIFVDGSYLKAKGTFFNSPLGTRCWEAIRSDLKGDREDRVRISIAFLDYQHKHLASGYVFERSEANPYCPECLKEFLEDEYGGKEFQKGHLIHLALTRVPVNKRTIMEVDRSMTTRKEDAESIVGELADELEEQASEVNRALVIKAEDEETEAEQPEVVIQLNARIDAIETQLGLIQSLLETKKSEAEEMDDEEDEEEDDEVVNSEASFNELADVLAHSFEALSESLGSKLDILIAASSKAVPDSVPQRRSVDPRLVEPQLQQKQTKSGPLSPRELARRSVGL